MVRIANPGRGLEEAILERLEHLEIATPISKKWRKAFLRKYPYPIVFEETGAEYRIIALMHLRRRPTYWKDRR